ncbi:hypothetical protein QAD02_011636 [Eretmocerus hayati]|uniref:Uncharacterized protein n=1 Tax=Eretmocerus hayati TaxID=131215 RepID=A0ACC2NWZ4_9HYME|nr:hypothetical protein QAD02_011636 [Eretmocerus hayati]
MAKKLATQHAVLLEQSFELTDGERSRPDFVVMNESLAQIIDIAVIFEKGDRLKEVAAGKIRKYSCLKSRIKNQLHVSKVEILPIVLGMRGAVPSETAEILRRLGFSPGDVTTMAMICIRSSLEMDNAFMDHG